MIITEELLNNLTEEAKKVSRLRMNYDLRNSTEDQSQRMLNAMEPGTNLPIHRHRTSSEVVIVIRGTLRQNFYDDNGSIVESFVVRAGDSVSLFVVPAGSCCNGKAERAGNISPLIKQTFIPFDK